MPQLFSSLQLLFLGYYRVIVHVIQAIFKNFFQFVVKIIFLLLQKFSINNSKHFQ
jgi:hypothetical protein